ncbi:MAG: hypothetical protein CYPHOPRED_002625 [Cyphobasidiales sp. Tagirdzhanova-0007]|nr:MAG: hypothetical protein CYPHOPRED_002625 [Cyphobasidiales sp. Tagirdzhanova-0007]
MSEFVLSDCQISAQAPIEDILAILKKAGGVIIKGLIDPEVCIAIKSELQPYIDAEDPKNKPPREGTNDFFPETTRKVGALITRSDTFARTIVPHPVLLGIAKDVLTVRNRFWMGEGQRQWCRSDPQVNVTSVLEIHPGAKRQPFHRDDYTFQRMLEPTEVWTKGRELSILTFTALSKVTSENGGTLFIPGSHLTGEDYAPEPEKALQAQMDVGDCFVMMCSCFHAGGANLTKEGDPASIRTVLALGYNQGMLRQEENQYLALDHEKLKRLPRQVQELSGWFLSQPNVGSVDFKHPLNKLGHDIAYTDEALYEVGAVA